MVRRSDWKGQSILLPCSHFYFASSGIISYDLTHNSTTLGFLSLRAGCFDMSTSLFRLGQVLRGRLGKYIITKEIQDTVWFARWVHGMKYKSLMDYNALPHRNQAEQTVVIKGVRGHPRVENERYVLKRFQDRTPYLRPLIDEVEDQSNCLIIVLRYLEDHLLDASIKETLNRKELKYVSRRILEALKVLHEDGYVHTGKLFAFPPRVSLNLRLKMSNLTMSS